MRVVITLAVDTGCASSKWKDFQMVRWREGRWMLQVVWRTVFAAGGIFFSRGEVLGSCRNQHHGSADLRVRPLGIPPKRRDPTGSPTAWIGNRGSRHLKQAMHPNGSTALLSTAQLSRPPAVRTSVSARWAGNRKPPSQRAAQQPGSETPMWTHLQTRRDRPLIDTRRSHSLKGKS